jgi:lipoate-protein ligase A
MPSPSWPSWPSSSSRPSAQPWHIEWCRGPAQELHDSSAALIASTPAAGGTGDPDPREGARAGRHVRILTAERPALVLGSSQPESDVDRLAAAGAGVDVVRRRSGGGAVLVEPRSVVWVDVIISAGDRLWRADVREATWWVGATWAAALEVIGAGPAQVWRGGMRRTSWSDRVCFAGLGPGEVCLDTSKVVGVSQRRTRVGALFQTAALLQWDPAGLLALLRLDQAERKQGAADLAGVAAGVGPGLAGAVVDAFLAALP